LGELRILALGDRSSGCLSVSLANVGPVILEVLRDVLDEVVVAQLVVRFKLA